MNKSFSRDENECESVFNILCKNIENFERNEVARFEFIKHIQKRS